MRLRFFLPVAGFGLALALFLTIHTPGQDPSPRAVIEELDFNAGAIASGQVVRHDFLVQNLGSTPLEIATVQPACGCTVANWDESIPPGKSGKISATLNTSGFSGPILKLISVTTNDSIYSTFDLSIRAIVRGSNVARLSTLQVKERFDAGGALFLDGRSPEEYGLTHISGAANLPNGQFEANFERLRSAIAASNLVVVYCAGPHCGLSEMVVQQLIQRGVPASKLAVYPEGMPGWIRASYPTISGSAR